jgi:hypothetical protein
VCVFQEAQRGQLGPQLPIEGDVGGVVPGLQHHGGVETRRTGAHRGGAAVTACHLVGEDELEEVLVGHVVLPCEGEALGQGLQDRAELQPAQHLTQLGGDGGCGSH